MLFAWTATWVASLVLATFGPGALWDSPRAASWAAIAANVVIGIGWIVAHHRYLQRVDELQRKIMLDALALTVGVGLVAGFAYAAAESSDLVALEVDVALFSAFMAVVYLGATIIGNLRYR